MPSALSYSNFARLNALGLGMCVIAGRVLCTSGAVNANSTLPNGVTAAKTATGKYTITTPQLSGGICVAIPFTASAAKDAKLHNVGAPATADGATVFTLFHLTGDADAAPNSTAPDAAADPADDEGFDFVIIGKAEGV